MELAGRLPLHWLICFYLCACTYGQIRNEAGALVSTQKDKPGHAYLNWKKKTHREVGGWLFSSPICLYSHITTVCFLVMRIDPPSSRWVPKEHLKYHPGGLMILMMCYVKGQVNIVMLYCCCCCVAAHPSYFNLTHPKPPCVRRRRSR